MDVLRLGVEEPPAIRRDGHAGQRPGQVALQGDQGAIDALTTLQGNLSWTLPGMTVSPDGQWLLYTQPEHVHSDILMAESYR